MWRHRSDGGARRLGFRLGGGVQRRLGVWRCSAGWGGGAARRTARVSRGDGSSSSLQLTTSRNLAFSTVLLHCNSRRRGIWFCVRFTMIHLVIYSDPSVPRFIFLAAAAPCMLVGDGWREAPACLPGRCARTSRGRCSIFAMHTASDYLPRLARAARRVHQGPRTGTFRKLDTL